MSDEIREAVEHLKFRLNFKDISETPLDKRNDEVDKILLDLAERVLNGEYVKKPSVEKIDTIIQDSEFYRHVKANKMQDRLNLAHAIVEGMGKGE